MNGFDDKERAIERVLSGLREKQAHAGLEQRVKVALEQRSFRAATQNSSRWRLWQLPAGAMMGLAAVVIMMVAGATVHFVEHADIPLGGNSTREGRTTAGQTRIPFGDDNERKRRTTAGQTQVPFGDDNTRKGQITARQARIAFGRYSERQKVYLSDGDAALGAAALRSFAAPEAPLTEQEKLLVKVALDPKPAQVAVLNPEQRAEIAAVDVHNFERFFQPSELEEKIDALQTAQLPPQN